MDETIERLLERIEQYVKDGQVDAAAGLVRGPLEGALAQAGKTPELIAEVAARLDELGVPHNLE